MNFALQPAVAQQPGARWRVLDLLFMLMLFALTLAALLQVLRFGPDGDNVLCVSLVWASSVLLFGYIWRSGSLRTHPMSTLALIGLCITSQAASLLLQTLDMTSFTRWLRAPVLTFSLLAMLHVVAVLTHWCYRHLTSLQTFTDGVARHLWSPLGILRIPHVEVTWLLSGIGLASFVLGGGATGDVGGKFIAAAGFLMWLPFMIPFYQHLQDGHYCDLRKHMPVIVAYALLVAGVAIVRNYRQVMFIGPMQGALVYLLYLARTKRPATARDVWQLSAGAILVAAGVWLAADLVTAMSVVRDRRTTATPMEMLRDTAEAYGNKVALEQERTKRDLDAIVSAYDEVYLSNPVVSRFSETKFHDNMFYLSQGMTDAEVADLGESVWRHSLTVLPQTVLDAFDIPIDKNMEMYSLGDMHLHLLTGADLGSFVTGSMWADLYALTWPFMPFVSALLMLLTFIVLDSLTRLDAGHFVSPAMLCTTWPIFLYGMGGESLAFKVSLLARDVPQRALIYALMLALVTQALKLLGLGRGSWSGAQQA